MAIGEKIATRESYGMALAQLGEKYDIVVMDATADIEKMNQNRQDEKKAYDICLEKIEKHKTWFLFT